MARGPWLALLEAGDTLTHDALHSIVRAMNEAPQARLLYSDECEFDDSPGRGLTRFVFKPDRASAAADDPAWPGHLAVHEATILQAATGSADEAGAGLEQLLADCAKTQAQHVVHVRRVLYLNHGGQDAISGPSQDLPSAATFPARPSDPA
jgi:hypothetical protein